MLDKQMPYEAYDSDDLNCLLPDSFEAGPLSAITDIGITLRTGLVQAIFGASDEFELLSPALLITAPIAG